MSIESMIAVRDAFFWWVGCGTLFGGLYVGVTAAVLRRSGKRIRLEEVPRALPAAQEAAGVLDTGTEPAASDSGASSPEGAGGEDV